ncbi:hypothetical protein [Turneriella parva]|uniref:Uncharacterized protein n=1 Tax=Turneriella parva (strain ATCC BAA-1111 / DSM 21527 / NCTC 11395 / H) TaxID=869212 RepID=I4B2E6_TURPD|nr:hypothetical protein [Turneriella parva]AFM11453.1 hypothetical protein Turpa_0802 [Turneriella parva DSM 21527]
MAKTSFNILSNLTFTGKGALLEVENIIGNVTFAQGISKAIGLFQNIDREYKKAVGNDGKIVGKERTDILMQVDRFMNGIILVWKKLEMRNDNMIVIENKNVNFLMNINERNGLWDASGTVPNFFVRPVKNFQEIYNNKLTPEIVALLKRYAEASEDGIIDDDEREDLKKGMQRVLYYTFFLRTQVEKLLIHD